LRREGLTVKALPVIRLRKRATRTYRKDWQDFFALFKGPVKFRITDVHIEAAGTLGYGHSIQYVSGTDMKGQPIELVVRVTDGYRKVDGNWLIAREHVSVPVDVTTGKPDLMSKS
jgi:ketosteroid isomerase-like protein